MPLVYFIRRADRFFAAVREEHRLKKAILILRAENQVLEQRIGEYKKGVVLEARARDDLGMIKKGEQIYLIK